MEEMLAAASQAEDPLCLVTGGEEALRRLVLDRLLAQAADRDVTLLRVGARDAGAAVAIAQAAGPTLFGGATWLFVTELEQGSDEVLAAVKDCLPYAGPDLRIVLAHAAAPRGRAVAALAQKLGARVFEARPVAVGALPGVLSAHVRERGCIITSEAATMVIDTIGQDLTALLATVEQLASDAPEGRIDAELVRDTLVAGGSSNQFEIADLVLRREAVPALVAFRQLADRNGPASACVTVVAALSYSLRTLIRYVTERPTGSPWQVASALGVSSWKVDALAAQAKRWRPADLAAAALVLAEADADAKGGMGDAGALDTEQKMFAVERLILELAAR